MQRSGPIEVVPHVEYSAWRDVRVRLVAPITMEEHILFEGNAHEDIGGFNSMPDGPLGGPLLTFSLRRPRDDVDVIQAEIDRCMESVNSELSSPA